MSTGHLPLSFRTPPVSPPRSSILSGMRRVYSLEFRPTLLNPPESGSTDPVLGLGVSEKSLRIPSAIYNWSCGYFSRPQLAANDDSECMTSTREEKEKLVVDHIVKCQHSCKYISLFLNSLFGYAITIYM